MVRVRSAVNLLTAKMIVYALLALLAFANAAPHYRHHHGHGPPPFPRHDDFGEHFHQDDIFDVRNFWDEIHRELLNIDRIYGDFAQHFPSTIFSEGVEGNVYKITITLAGFEEKEIVVKAKKGFVIIQAVHKIGDNILKSYMDMRTLPDFVNEAGKWGYENDVLTIEFPLNAAPSSPGVEITTQTPHSREEMDPSAASDADASNQDVDVGAQRGDVDKANELLTDEVPRQHAAVEATTYSVDLKDDVEFVPIIPKRQVK